ncbi:VWA domain-containing protein [Pseudomonas gingeri]|uniref:vWA domain-containing protein n=1 Tax=Pseudomonas gingeri TaxID=117681 RepID=UPI0015A25BCF|nr:VWA domain-containing protein [Pseudomonas gingeri]NVZ24445.1 VWA domain-containing protein [Pseudomonas gingeri]
MGRVARPGIAGGGSSGNPELAKKALGIRPRPTPGANARAGAGRVPKGRQGAARAGEDGAISWVETLLGGRPRVRRDLRFRPRSSSPHELWLVIVDASASIRRHQALSDAKGLLAQLFDDAYRQRARLALLTASGQRPHWQIQGLKASSGLRGWLEALGAGGGTPLLAALQEAGEWLALRQKRFALEQQRVLVLTDGRLKAWTAPAPFNCPTLLIDLEKAPIRLGRARQLASELAAEYRHIESLGLPSNS